MIPLRLELNNFLAYRNPAVLDLTGVHLACLVGANGAGKSSLLDAMTWALWGKARARRDDELIHGKEREMQVVLDFLMDGNHYRVSRYRARGKSSGRGSSELVLEVLDGEDWRNLTEPTMRATQEKITRIMRLDYETFINSAFLAQGRADEFTNKTPGERKSILGEILALNAWPRYEERAKQHIRLLTSEIDQIDGEIAGIDNELGREDEYRIELDARRRELDEITQEMRAAEQRYNELDEHRRKRIDLSSRYDDLQRRIQFDNDQLDRMQANLAQQLERLEAYQGVMAAQDDIERGHLALNEAREKERALNDSLRIQSDLSRQQHELQQAVTAARRELETEQRMLAERRAKLEQSVNQAHAENTGLAELEEKVAGLVAREAERDAARSELNAVEKEYAALESQNQSLKKEMDTLALQRDQVAAMEDAICPLCGQGLSDEHRAALLEKLEQDGNDKAALYRSNREQLDTLDQEMARLNKAIKNFDQELRNLPPLRDHVIRLQEQVARVQADQEELSNLDEQIGQVSEELDNDDYAHEERAALDALQIELAALGYNEDEHQTIRDTIDQMKGFEDQKRELDLALEQIPELETGIADLERQTADLDERISGDRSMLLSWEQEIAELDELLVDFEYWEKELNRLREEEGHARYRVGLAEQKVNTLDALRSRRSELVERRSNFGEELTVYEDLRQAFGKDGVPAMIIEAAIPEIEKEANQILSQMTDSQMYVQFETQREKVTGGTKETLDIRIADGLGARDYATFSGGEAFRVNFSIRLALSRLLARRAGAQLRTLIIDEGFGTQDALGRERLVQAINTIQNEFDLIMVITHIEELKDAFPARIEVTKTANGSVVELI